MKSGFLHLVLLLAIFGLPQITSAQDADGDGLTDSVETGTGVFVNEANTGTNPNLLDTDADGFDDGLEALYSTANPTNPASRPLRTGLLDLLAYWHFNDASDPAQALDTVKGFIGLLENTTVYTADGEGRTGLAGDRAVDLGVSGGEANAVLVDLPRFLNIAATQNQVAVSFWQRLDAVVNSSSFWAEATGEVRGLNGHATWSDGSIYWDTAGCCTGANHRVSGPPGIDLLNAWHHFVFQKNGNAKEVWLDGALVVSGNNTNPLNADFTVLHIGSDSGTASIAGRIDDFAIFADALTPAQVASLFAGASPPSISPPSTDTDGDGMPNAYETANGLNPNVDDRAGDLDADLKTNFDEFLANTLPNNPDSDGDTLKDGWETKTGTYVSATNTGTDPLKGDTDNDGLGDGAENNSGTFVSAASTGTNPHNADTDGDGAPDGPEVTLGSNPNDPASIASVIAGGGKWDTEHVWTNSAPQLNDTAGAEAALDAPPGTFPPTDTIKVKTSYVHFHDNVEPPWFVTQSKPYPLWDPDNGGTGFGDREDFAIRSKGKIKITKAGMAWFDCNSDDGFSLRIDGTAIGSSGNRGRADTVMSANLTAGLHDVELIHWERGGGAGVSLLIYRGITDVAPPVSPGTWQLLEIFLDVLDTDGDGMLDSYEAANGLNTAVNDAAADKDGDTLSNLTEFQGGTRADKADTDGDGLNDNVETGTGTFVNASNTGTKPLRADTDDDGLVDGAENNSGTFVSAANAGTNPHKVDTDDDTWSDSAEVAFGSNPNVAASLPSLTPGLDILAYWPFNDASRPLIAKDIVHNIEATLVGGAAYTADAGGRSGAPGDRALDLGLAQTGQTAQVLNAMWLNLASPDDQLAVSYWQNLGQVTNSSSLWVTSASSGDRGFQVHSTWSDGNIYFDTSGCCNASHRVSASAGIDLVGSWHHFLAQKNGSAKEVWMDGVLTVSGTNDLPLASDLDDLFIGSAIGGSNSTVGLIDEFAFFGDALTEAQILRLAAGEAPTALLGPTAPLVITAFSANAANHTVTITWASQANTSYALEGSRTMATGSWIEINDNITSGGATTSFTYDVNLFPPGGSTPPILFLRVVKP